MEKYTFRVYSLLQYILQDLNYYVSKGIDLLDVFPFSQKNEIQLNCQQYKFQKNKFIINEVEQLPALGISDQFQFQIGYVHLSAELANKGIVKIEIIIDDGITNAADAFMTNLTIKLLEDFPLVDENERPKINFKFKDLEEETGGWYPGDEDGLNLSSSDREEEINESKQPWGSVKEEIPGDRKIAKLWHKGDTSAKIATELHVTERTVNNRVTILRKKYGEEIFPYRRRKNRGRKRKIETRNTGK